MLNAVEYPSVGLCIVKSKHSCRINYDRSLYSIKYINNNDFNFNVISYFIVFIYFYYVFYNTVGCQIIRDTYYPKTNIMTNSNPI